MAKFKPVSSDLCFRYFIDANRVFLYVRPILSFSRKYIFRYRPRFSWWRSGTLFLGTGTTVPYQIDEEAAPLPQQPRGRQALLVARSTNGVVAGLSTPAWLPPCCSPLFDFSPARDHLNDRSTVGGLQVGRKLRKVPTFGREIDETSGRIFEDISRIARRRSPRRIVRVTIWWHFFVTSRSARNT